MSEATADEIITWVFEEGNFAPMAKIKGDKRYSIVTDHLDTPILGYSDSGDKVWERELDSFGKARMSVGDEGFEESYLGFNNTLENQRLRLYLLSFQAILKVNFQLP